MRNSRSGAPGVELPMRNSRRGTPDAELPMPNSRCGTPDVELAFQMLKMGFYVAPILQHINLNKLIILLTNASGITIAGILNQYDGFAIILPVN